MGTAKRSMDRITGPWVRSLFMLSHPKRKLSITIRKHYTDLSGESQFDIYILAHGTYNKKPEAKKGGGSMFLDGLDELDQRIVRLLIENARMSYSDIGKAVGISRVAVKARVQALE